MFLTETMSLQFMLIDWSTAHVIQKEPNFKILEALYVQESTMNLDLGPPG